METFRLFLLILKRTHGDKILTGFAAYFILASLLLWILDPDIHSWGDGVWLAFNIATSIGLGDYTVTTLGARLTAGVLGLYGTVIVAFIPGMIASYYMEKISFSANQTVEQYYDELSNIDTMNKDELKNLSSRIAGGHRS